MKIRPTLTYSHWLEFCHDVILHVPPIGSTTQRHIFYFGFSFQVPDETLLFVDILLTFSNTNYHDQLSVADPGFPRGHQSIFGQFFAEKLMKMKKFWPGGHPSPPRSHWSSNINFFSQTRRR